MVGDTFKRYTMEDLPTEDFSFLKTLFNVYRFPPLSLSRSNNGGKITRSSYATTHACHPSGLIMHRRQPRGNLADAVKTVVLYAYTVVHARLPRP